MRAPRLSPSLDKFLALRLMTAGTIARRELEQACRARGRPLREVLVLMLASEQELTSAAIADRLGLQRAELSRLVRELHYEGWIELAPSLYDGRAKAIQAGSGASRIAAAAEPGFAMVDRRLRANLTPLRQRQLEICLELLKGPKTPVADALNFV